METGNRVRVTPLIGAHSEGPVSYLLQLDQVTILLDCGWDDHLDPTTIQPIIDRVGDIDAVLISHSDTAHLGALPYLVGKKGLNVPVYCTLPVHKMGQMFLYDIFLSRQAAELDAVFDLDDVDSAFSLVQPLKYSQCIHLAGAGGDQAAITVTPYLAGHLLGGTLWKISKETEDIIYAVDLNHKKERHLNGAVIETFNRPGLLITDAYTALRPPSNARADKDLSDVLLKVLRSDGSVLMPVDTAGRVLELVLTLELMWTHAKLGAYQLVLMTSVAYNTLEFAKSHLEWMNDAISNSFDHHRTNAFTTRHLHLCHSKEELLALGPGPKVVMASMGSLEVGPARELFSDWAGVPNNLILFTDLGQPNTLAREVMHKVARARQHESVARMHAHASQPAPSERVAFTLQGRARVALEGEELREFEIKRDVQEAEAQAARVAATVAVPSTHGWSNAMSQPHPQDQASPMETDAMQGGQIDGEKSGRTGKWKCLCEGFEPDQEAAGPMFPHTNQMEAWDDYGQPLPESFLASFNQAQQDGKNTMEPDDSEVNDDPTAEPPAPEIPTKIVDSTKEVVVRCAVLYLDMEGRSDARSIKMILQHMAPLQLVLVHGSYEATEALKCHCEKALAPAKVYAPRVGELLDCSSAIAAYKVKLTEEIMSKVHFKRVDAEYEVSWIDGQLGHVPMGERHIPLEPLDSETEVPHKAALVGTVKLSDFKHTLTAAGVPAEFSGGVLLCGGNVTVRKDASTQKLVLEGALSEDYYKIRGVLYSQYHIL